jgi:tetratricopeptide (TPR) repeat protein
MNSSLGCVHRLAGSLAPVACAEAPFNKGGQVIGAITLHWLRLGIALCLVALLPYVNALRADFTFDDLPHIRNNPVVTEGVDVWRIFSTPLPPGNLYRPLTVLTYAVNEQLAPGQAAVFHAVNLALHALVTVLVFLLAQHVMGSARVAMLAAVLFAVHPVHAEAVSNIVGRAELLAALFGLTALLAAAAAMKAPSSRRRLGLEVASLAAFCLALLSKESALTLLLLVPLVRLTQRSEPLLRGIRHELRDGTWVPYALCAVLFVVLRFVVVTALPSYTLTPLDNVLAFVPWHLRVASALAVLWDYFGLLNFPVVLAADYSYDQVPLVMTWYAPRFVAGLMLVVVAIALAVRGRRPAATFAVLFPFVSLLLTANVVFPIGTVKAERLLYLPSVGWCLLAAWVFDRLLTTQRYARAAALVLALCIAAFAGRTWTRNWDWQDNQVLYRSMAHSAPDSAKARYNFGVALQRENDDAAAVGEFERALALYPWSEGAAFGIGLSFDRKGAVEPAIVWYRKALDIDPGYTKAHSNLCRLYLLHGRFAEAEAACRAGLRFEPTDANLMKGLAESLAGGGDLDRGRAALQRAIALDPSDASWRLRAAVLDHAEPVCGLPVEAMTPVS